MSAGLGVGKRSSGGSGGGGSRLAGFAVGTSGFSQVGVPVGLRILVGRKLGLEVIRGVGKMVGSEEGRLGRFVGLIVGLGASDIGDSDELLLGMSVVF